MFSSLLRPKRSQTRGDRSPFSSPFTQGPSSPVATRRNTIRERRIAAVDYDESNISEEEEVEEDEEDEGDEDGEEDDEDGLPDSTPLLPMFSAAHLDALPIYNITHAIRLLVVARCETTLSWDQLRSPQVSQFLLKPIQQEIRTSHFSRATLYALMANCLQFNKEMDMNPGNSGTSKTRSMVCELLGIKLLKEFTTRELIDALNYDFDPLHGQTPPGTAHAIPAPNWDSNQRGKTPSRAARISCLEIAIRAQAKRFLAHPLVVQQLEAIWAGTIVFHSAADNLHRPPVKVTPNQNRGYGAINSDPLALEASPSKLQPAKQREHHEAVVVTIRRSVTLYDPRDASLFKLSRLRVPRYRQFLSTCSFAVLLGLFLAVLAERSLEITPLEVVFWFWSAGFMLDEIVGFNEQGFSLYLMSFWNTFDLGILLMLVIHYCLRLYGIVMPDTRKHGIANMAYDVLAATAILLFPRLFSVLDHYRYFSQLLIAFRMMAADLVAVFTLIVISCSGFFVAFTLSFGGDDYESPAYDSPGSVAYALFQILMGFTPAAWERWPKYNLLGKSIMTLFLFICHFLVVTILITVLTNSFMAIVQNANEEHQFVFAVNTISMVKSDALFSYIAPTNIIAWLLTPLRYFVPFRRFVRINRTAIKITHFPILFSIYLYEKTILRSNVFEGTDLVELRGRSPGQLDAVEEDRKGLNLFSPKPRRLVREPSIATYQKDRALDEVFRRPFKDTVRDSRTSHVVNNWMQGMGPTGVASPPAEQDRAIVDRLEARRPSIRRSQLLRRNNLRTDRDITDATRSVASDPEDFMSNTDFLIPPPGGRPVDTTPSPREDPSQQTDADGDDELITNDNEEEENMTLDRRPSNTALNVGNGLGKTIQPKDYFTNTPTPRNRTPEMSTSLSSIGRARFISPPTNSPPKSRRQSPTRPKTPRRHHLRNISTNTILYAPVHSDTEEKPPSPSACKPKITTTHTSARGDGSGGGGSGAITPATASAGRRTPKRPAATPGASSTAKPRPIMPPKNSAAFMSAPNLAGLVMLDQSRYRGDHHYHNRDRDRRPSSLALDLGSDLGDNKAIGGGFVGAVPASFATQMAYATGAMKMRRDGGSSDDQGMFGRLMLARMNGLEEGFREMITEVRDLRREGGGSRSRKRSWKGKSYGSGGGRSTKDKGKERERERKKERKEDDDAKNSKGKGRAKSEEGWIDEDVGDDYLKGVKGSSV